MADDVIKKLLAVQGPLYTGPIKMSGRFFTPSQSLQGAIIGLGKAYVETPDGEWELANIRIEMNVEDAKKTASDLLHMAKEIDETDGSARANRHNPLRKKKDGPDAQGV